ncbi:MAG: (2Fe-2S)-binding protein [Leptospiraceae bacterium]|nr:(2Fe-2S)-binding protein [Leptospiraceae bacterium]
MAKIFVDGREYEVDEKKNLIDALAEKGVEIPHFCYHSKLSVVGMCRICLIEVEGVPKFQAACNTPVKDGMKINAFGEKIVKAREGVMEFLLINHPLDCPVCDKAGECRLQNYSFSLGHETTRYKEEKRNIPQEKIGTNLLINHNRCILCYRCVRFDREVVGVNDLEMLARGNDTIIAYTPPETSGEKSTYLNHNYQGALADICPVGALLNENTLFQSRVWWYESKESYCHGCSTLCKVTTNIKNNSLYRYMPPQNTFADGHFICDYGRFSGKDFSQNRLLHYAMNGEKTTSAQALPALDEKIAAAKKILVLGGATESCEDVDAIDAQISAWRAQGKEVKWDFRTDSAAFYDGKSQPLAATSHWDFLLHRDLRPNAKYLRDKNATALSDYAALAGEIRNADLVIVIGELSAPYAYQSGEKHAHVKGLTIRESIEDSELFQLLNTAAAWNKTALFTTHANTAAGLAAIALPILAYPEKAGRYSDKAGSIKMTTAVLKPVQGLKSPNEIFSRLGAQKQMAEAAR